MPMTDVYDVIIVGAGPGGMTAALYASRAGFKTLMIEKELPGGQMNNTALVENFIGFPSITGSQLSRKMYEHATAFGAEDVTALVQTIEKLPNELFLVKTDGGDYHTRTVIVATGTQNRMLEVPGETDFAGMGVSYCAICDGPFFRDQRVAVVGGGDSALEEASYLANIASEVHLLHRRDTFRAKPYLQEEVKQNAKITIHYNTSITEIMGSHEVEEVTLQEGSLKRGLSVEGVFIYAGQIPQTSFLQPLGILDEQGYVKVDERYETTVSGLFAVGDILPKAIRQIANAVGEGAVAAQSITAYVKVNN